MLYSVIGLFIKIDCALSYNHYVQSARRMLRCITANNSSKARTDVFLYDLVVSRSVLLKVLSLALRCSVELISFCDIFPKSDSLKDSDVVDVSFE